MDKLAVLIPCYNEGKTIEKVVTDCKKAIANISNSVVYVYDNNSTDDTVELAEKLVQLFVMNICRVKAMLFDACFGKLMPNAIS